ncbi:MAG: hypothetical protein ABR964_04970 [Tepidisphaeraceae bacterium]|jgi:hypothetical protein
MFRESVVWMAAAIAVGAWAAPVRALTLNPGDDLLNQTIPTQSGAPSGTVLADTSQSVTLMSGSVTLLSGTLEQQVLQDPVSKQLTFFDSFTPTTGSSFVGNPSVLLSSYKGFATDLQGFISPIAAGSIKGEMARSADGSTISALSLSAQNASEQAVAFGGLAVVTDATTWDKNGSLELSISVPQTAVEVTEVTPDQPTPPLEGSQTLAAYEPIPVPVTPGVPLPPALEMGIVALAGAFGLQQARRLWARSH